MRSRQVSQPNAEQNSCALSTDRAKAISFSRSLSDLQFDSLGANLPTQAMAPLLQGQGMRDAEMVIWLGDFNYRIELSFEIAKEKARRKLLTDLLAKVRKQPA